MVLVQLHRYSSVPTDYLYISKNFEHYIPTDVSKCLFDVNVDYHEFFGKSQNFHRNYSQRHYSFRIHYGDYKKSCCSPSCCLQECRLGYKDKKIKYIHIQNKFLINEIRMR